MKIAFIYGDDKSISADLHANGWTQTFGWVPSPADLEKALLK